MKVQVPGEDELWDMAEKNKCVSNGSFIHGFVAAIAYANEQLTSKSPFLNDLEVHELGKELRGSDTPPTKKPFLSDGEIEDEVKDFDYAEDRELYRTAARWARDKYEAAFGGGVASYSSGREKILMQFIESEYRLRQEQYNEMCDADCGVSGGEIDDGWVQLKNRIKTALNVPAVEAGRRFEKRHAYQTFYVIKRDEEPAYWNPGFGWQEKPMLTTSAGEHNRWKRDLDLKALLPTSPTARIVKVMVSEVEG